MGTLKLSGSAALTSPRRVFKSSCRAVYIWFSPKGCSFTRRHASPCCSASHPGGSQPTQPGPEVQHWVAEQQQDVVGYSRDASLLVGRPASISRAVFAAQPGRVAQQAFRGGRGRIVPSTLLVFAITVGAAVWTAVRQRLHTVRECKVCRGYGIQRCKLCSGSGKISWEGKMAHDEPCPMCLGRRYTKCNCCGGHFARTTFMHLAAPGDTALLNTLASLDRSSNAAAEGQRKGSSVSQRRGGQRIYDELDALANEIMTD